MKRTQDFIEKYADEKLLPYMKMYPGYKFTVSQLGQKTRYLSADVLRALKYLQSSGDVIHLSGKWICPTGSAGRNPVKGTKKCPDCGAYGIWKWDAGGWYCPKCRNWFFPSDLRRNPGAAYHKRTLNDAIEIRERFNIDTQPYTSGYYDGVKSSSEASWKESIRRGIPNPLRPPKAWWGMMRKKIMFEYPPRKGENRKHYERSISQIVAGIWWNQYTKSTRDELVRKFESNPILETLGTYALAGVGLGAGSMAAKGAIDMVMKRRKKK